MKNLKQNFEFLNLISKCKKKTLKNAIIQHGDKEQINSLCECVFNTLNGNFKLNDDLKFRLKPYKKVMRKLVAKNSIVNKKKILKQQGGFISTLLPVILSTLAPLFLEK